MLRTFRFSEGKKRMIEKLFEKKKKIEEKIFCIECADKLRPEERSELNSLYVELSNIRFQIDKEKI